MIFAESDNTISLPLASYVNIKIYKRELKGKGVPDHGMTKIEFFDRGAS